MQFVEIMQFFLLGASVFIQFFVAFLGFELFRIIPDYRVWVSFSVGFLLMGTRRLLAFMEALSKVTCANYLFSETFAFLSSVFLATGVLAVRSFFLSMKEAQEQLEEIKERYRSLVESTDDSVYLVDKECRFLYLNPKYLARIGIPEEKILGKHYSEFHSPVETKEFQEKIEQVIKTGCSIQYEHRSKRDNRYYLRTLSPVKNQRGETIAVTVISKDITQIKEIQNQLSFLATHDLLTFLPNRALFMDRLKMAIAYAKRYNQRLAVMLIDLDNFKEINDTYGHGVGDEVLRIIGKKLRGSIRESDTVARMGGDEFLVLLPYIKSEEDAFVVANHIQERLRELIKVEDKQFKVSASIGISIYPDDGEEAEELLKNADKAMYLAKLEGGNAFKRLSKVLLSS